MIVKCIKNKRDVLPKVSSEFAYPIGSDEDTLDVTIGLHYTVFAVNEGEGGTFYFVHPDTMAPQSWWWMPATLFEVIDGAHPEGWITQKNEGNGNIFTKAYASLFDGGVEEDIIDNEEGAIDTYRNQAEADPTFPTEEQLAILNKEFFEKLAQEKHEEELKNAHERGWEYPKK